MRGATRLSEFSGHWEQYLQSIRRCWNKAETHYVAKPKWAALQKTMMRRIFDEPVTGYIWYARDGEGHGVPSESAQPFAAGAVAAREVVCRGNTYRPPIGAEQAPMGLLAIAEGGLAFYQRLLKEIEAELK